MDKRFLVGGRAETLVVALFEIEDEASVAALTVRHQLEDDYHWSGLPRHRAGRAKQQ